MLPPHASVWSGRRGPADWTDAALTGVYALLIVVLVLTARDPDTWPVFVGVAIAASALLVPLWRRSNLTTGQVLALAVLFRLVAFPLTPTLSDDAFRYVWDGWLQIQGINPYLHAPSDAALAAFQDAPIYEQLNSAAYYSVYPPLSQLIFAVGGLAYPLGWSASYYLIKAVLVGVELGGVFVLARMIRPQALLLYAWNPLVVIETAGQAHTEAAMVGLLVVTVWAVRTNRPRWASVALAGAGLVKLYPFMLAPLLIWRFGWKSLWPGVAVTVALSLPYAAPGVIGNVSESLRLYVQLFEFNAGPYYGVKYLFTVGTGADWSKTLGPAFGVVFGISLVALYVADALKKWSFAASALAILSVYLACSTTVHPWYLLGPLALGVLLRPPFWAALWLGAFSIGTYLFYTGGPYWGFVIAGWVGAGLLALLYVRDPVLQWIQRRRAEEKVDRLQPYLASLASSRKRMRLLDLGAGEGYVGAAIRRRVDAEVVLCDIVDFNQTDLPLVEYDGRDLPFDDDVFDATVLYFVLHHAEAPERVLSEALRVSRDAVIVVESLKADPVQHRLLRGADRLANRLRSGGRMAQQEAHLQFRTAGEWRDMVAGLDAAIRHEERFGSWLHPQLLLVIEV